MLKADLHIHTKYSMDCDMPLEKIINRCLETGINCITIADHGTIEGALEMQRLAPFTIIIAEEVLTHHGEIMGMFLKEPIPSGQSVEETISQIRAQGGLVCIPHAFDLFRPSINIRLVHPSYSLHLYNGCSISLKITQGLSLFLTSATI